MSALTTSDIKVCQSPSWAGEGRGGGDRSRGGGVNLPRVDTYSEQRCNYADQAQSVAISVALKYMRLLTNDDFKPTTRRL